MFLNNGFVLLLLASVAIIAIILIPFLSSAGKSLDSSKKIEGPQLHDDNLQVKLVTDGLQFPTSMRFLDDGSILVLQKNDGKVFLITNDGQKQLVLKTKVTSDGERGLLGIAVSKSDTKSSVFLYLTQSVNGKIRNQIYQYIYDEGEQTLQNKTLILDLPGEPGPYHNGGKIVIGPDECLYAIIGDVSSGGGKLDNQIPGRPLDDQSVIFRVDKDTGIPPDDNPFYQYGGDMEKLRSYYAYGIRNSFGMDFDPVSGKLWITENGPEEYDEINIVEPGFNSGWHKVIGPISRGNMTTSDLVSFNGSKYADPAFSWRIPIGITDIEFLDSPKLGEKYENNVFVGDINNGNIYFFKLNGSRNGFEFDSSALSDLVADPVGNDTLGEVSPQIFAKNFTGRITDIETGPDGYLYVLTYLDGKIYKIMPRA